MAWGSTVLTFSKVLIEKNQNTTEFAILGGGCFWCLEAVYQEVTGVLVVESGYSGGHLPHPSYEQVCSKATGHAEVVRLEFDPGRVAYRKLLEIFFVIHDPTTLNRQGNDVGSQYRSIILSQNTEQSRIAHEVVAEIERLGVSPIVTEIAPATTFYRAEEEHQNYYRRHPHRGYCALVVAPKLETFRHHFADKSERPT
jgi:peptide-methionine (S)-S-oxide reductase